VSARIPTHRHNKQLFLFLQLNVGVAIFVLPFNSALNPFLYTINILLEKWRKALDDRPVSKAAALTLLADWVGRGVITASEVEVTLRAAGSSTASTTLSTSSPVTKETALTLLADWLGRGVITAAEFEVTLGAAVVADLPGK
jgi:hypothetical protein